MEGQAAESYDCAEAVQAPADEAPAAPKPNRWHAVLADGELRSAPTKNQLKKQLDGGAPRAKVLAILRGKVVPLATKVTF